MATRDFCIPNPRFGYWEEQPAREKIGQWHGYDATDRLFQYLGEAVCSAEEAEIEPIPERFRR